MTFITTVTKINHKFEFDSVILSNDYKIFRFICKIFLWIIPNLDSEDLFLVVWICIYKVSNSFGNEFQFQKLLIHTFLSNYKMSFWISYIMKIETL